MAMGFFQEKSRQLRLQDQPESPEAAIRRLALHIPGQQVQLLGQDHGFLDSVPVCPKAERRGPPPGLERI